MGSFFIEAQVQDWAVSQGAAVMLDREAEAGSLGAGDLSRAALPTAQPQAEWSFHVRLCATPETAAHPALPSPGLSRQEHWSGCHRLLRSRVQ